MSLVSAERQAHVRAALDQLPERDRRLLRQVFFDENDKDTVCKDFGVDRQYLRVLLHRAKARFREVYEREHSRAM
jgi:RNA polymerase sigma-70 factor (ECF subfamily)